MEHLTFCILRHSNLKIQVNKEKRQMFFACGSVESTSAIEIFCKLISNRLIAEIFLAYEKSWWTVGNN